MHLKRAFGFVAEVEKVTEDFRRRASYTNGMDDEQPFLQGMLDARRGSKQLEQQKVTCNLPSRDLSALCVLFEVSASRSRAPLLTLLACGQLLTTPCRASRPTR